MDCSSVSMESSESAPNISDEWVEEEAAVMRLPSSLLCCCCCGGLDGAFNAAADTERGESVVSLL